MHKLVKESCQRSFIYTMIRHKSEVQFSRQQPNFVMHYQAILRTLARILLACIAKATL